MTINKCLNCGSGDFLIHETIFHKAVLFEDDGDLNAYKVHDHMIEIIICEECEKEYSEDDFKSINF